MEWASRRSDAALISGRLRTPPAAFAAAAACPPTFAPPGPSEHSSTALCAAGATTACRVPDLAAAHVAWQGTVLREQQAGVTNDDQVVRSHPPRLCHGCTLQPHLAVRYCCCCCCCVVVHGRHVLRMCALRLVTIYCFTSAAGGWSPCCGCPWRCCWQRRRRARCHRARWRGQWQLACRCGS